MLLAVIAGGVILLLVATELGFIPPLTAHTLIRIRRGSVGVERGQVSARTLDHVTAILGDCGVTEGYIAVAGKRVAFSRLIPEQIHQQLRNVLLNQFR
ncbi:MAG TPA: hypothetical protein VKB34_22955 [Povalibacter sp.]|nr:hypothetical protein [Povalibacter sp.]